MNQILLIWLCAAAIASGGLLVLWIFAMVSGTALSKNPRVSLEDDRVAIFARSDTLEYELRLALTASVFRRRDIIVLIARNDPSEAEMTDLILKMRRRHKNIFYKMI